MIDTEMHLDALLRELLFDNIDGCVVNHYIQLRRQSLDFCSGDTDGALGCEIYLDGGGMGRLWEGGDDVVNVGEGAGGENQEGWGVGGNG